MMNKKVKETLEIPEDVEWSLDGNEVSVSGPRGELSREFDMKGVDLEREGDELIVLAISSRKEFRASVGTVLSHVNNMIEGVTEGFSSKLKVFYSHFPVTVGIEGNKIKIENFVGGEKPLYADIVGDTEVDIKGEEIIVSGFDKEAVGQTAANIEEATKLKNRDPRVFQDGIYIVERP
ncbi:MAG: 50S ribosomal protein L6 [Candidatus Hadarchaeota archaeon]